MRTHRRKRWWQPTTAVLLAGALVAAACGDDDGVDATDEDAAGSDDTASSLQTWSYDLQFLTAEGTPSDSVTWTPLSPDEVSQEWEICAAIVHLKDSYWSALDYGLAEEAKRTGTNFTLLAAGGYTELSTQLDQLDDCVARGADGIILGATSPEGVAAKAEEIVGRGIPVVGIGVPVLSDDVPVAFASFRLQGRTVGEFVLEQIDELGLEPPVNVAWFPGPEGAGWPEDSLRGFEETVEGEGVEIVDVKWGDTGREVQLNLVEDTLQAHDDIDFIVGNAVAATVAPQALSELGEDIPVVSTYITPETYEGMKNGEIIGTVSDSTALTGRLGYDILLRILEGEDFLGTSPTKDIGPEPVLVTEETLSDFEAERTFHITPSGFEPVFEVG